ncbi:hypothetical protein JMM62_21385 [Rhodovulum sulfidophilum]|nr:hypothetical protein [Rhodovulum sulfidophilum]
MAFFDILADAVSEPEISAAHARLRRAHHALSLIHLPVARRIAVRRTPQGEDPEDYFQEAFFALDRAIWKFDLSRDNRSMTYVSFGIREAVARFAAEKCALIRIPVHRHEVLRKMDALDAEHERLALCPELPPASRPVPLQRTRLSRHDRRRQAHGDDAG